MDFQVKLWLEHNGRVIFGQGRRELLMAVANTGSLAGAARELGMSYRAAWGRMKASEERLGYNLMEPAEQGKRGMRLTSQAHELLDRFEDLEQKAQKLVANECAKWPSDLSPADEDEKTSEE